jgi:membrane protein implicated in regulation of membrane protease activity
VSAPRRTRFLRDNGLTLAFLLLLLLSLVAQAFTGVTEFNQQQVVDGAQQVSLWQYVASSSFGVDVAENWQSEYLQFALYIVATVWLVQRGSSESKKLDEIGTQSDKEQLVGRHAESDSPAWARAGGLRTALYGRSLGGVMAFYFLMSLAAQSVAGRAAYNLGRLHQHEDPVTWLGYATSADFWNRTTQNWQSEFLAVASMAAFAIYLRQRGSPESKLVGASHEATAQDA